MWLTMVLQIATCNEWSSCVNEWLLFIKAHTHTHTPCRLGWPWSSKVCRSNGLARSLIHERKRRRNRRCQTATTYTGPAAAITSLYTVDYVKLCVITIEQFDAVNTSQTPLVITAGDTMLVMTLMLSPSIGVNFYKAARLEPPLFRLQGFLAFELTPTVSSCVFSKRRIKIK